MQQWKNKLFNDDQPPQNDAEGNGADDDVVSNHSAVKSSYSRASKNSDSPFLQISR